MVAHRRRPRLHARQRRRPRAADRPVVTGLAARYGKSPAQVVLRWHIEHEFSAIPKSVKPHRIAENFDVLDFSLAPDEVAAIDALDTGVRGGPDPETLDLDTVPIVVDNS